MTVQYADDSTPSKLRESQLGQELARVRQEYNDFVYIVSHDLKAPLRAIDSLASWIVKDYAAVVDEEGQELLTLLRSRVNQMNTLLEGLLQYSRAGRIEEDKVEINLNQFLADIIKRIDPPGQVEITVEGDLPSVWIEQTQLEQVFTHLLSNAVKYIDKPEGKVKISCVEADDHWQFRVVDNGPGIDKKQFARIFQIFQTLQPSDETDSCGAGLAITRKIIELWGGAVWVESEIRHGSTFYFSLPKENLTLRISQGGN